MAELALFRSRYSIHIPKSLQHEEEEALVPLYNMTY